MLPRNVVPPRNAVPCWFGAPHRRRGGLRVGLLLVSCVGMIFSLSGISGEPPLSADALVERGMKQLVDGKVQAAIADFDQAVRLKPSIDPQLWQRGIAYYYANRFADGARQFERHRQVNPHDVENAAWHFLCVAKSKGAATARKQLIAIDTKRDRRVPMSEIYDLFRGEASAEDVLAAAKRAGSPRAMMYAHLYLGLHAEATGKAEVAKSHLLQAAEIRADGSYMHQIAVLHTKLRHWKP